MKVPCLFTAVLLLALASFAQQAQVVVFKHDLRWTDETKFPNYFLSPEIRDSIVDNTRQQLKDYLKVADVKFPKDVDYKIFNGFGKQEVGLPGDVPGNDPVIGLFSFITRATVGYAIYWKFNIIIKQNNKTILAKEVVHELEYANVSGYLTSQLWISPGEFQQVFERMINEALTGSPAANEKIILGITEAKEEQARGILALEASEKEAGSLIPEPSRYLLKINGAWRSAGNFAGLIESADDTALDFSFKQGGKWEWPNPSFSGVLASLFTEATGIGIEYEQKVLNQIKGKLLFGDGHKLGIRLQWIEIATRTTTGDEVSSQITAPLKAELFDDKQQVGYFLYTRLEEVRTTDQTSEKLNVYSGFQKENTLGIELIHRIEGSLFNKPILAEYNENQGIIKIKSGEEIQGVMVVLNCNPDSRSIGNVTLSDNKRFVVSSGRNFGKPSLKNAKHLEWYPTYLPGNASDESMKICAETLICLFFGMGNM